MVDDVNNLVYLDIAGLNDTDGPMADMINSFLLKMMFKFLTKVKLLVPISLNQLTNQRGTQTKETIQTLQSLCSTSLRDLASSVQPVITQVKKSDKPDLDVFKGQIGDAMISYLEEQVKDRNIEDDEQEDIRTFITAFEENTVIFDPLDRELYQEDNEDENIAEKRDDLVNKLVNLKNIDGSLLNAPFPSKLKSTLNKMFET